jgi:hypothetical protein
LPAAWETTLVSHMHLDLQIAATCWTAGFDVATENRRDFESIADLIAELAPDAPRLAIVGPPI